MAKWIPLASAAPEGEDLAAEYAAGSETGVLRLGERRLFFRKGRKIYYVAYTELSRCFRRVMVMKSGLLRGREVYLENLVLCGAEGELAVIHLPGAQAAEKVLAALKKLAPHALFTKP